MIALVLLLAAAPQTERVQWVTASVARVGSATLPIGVEVRVLRVNGATAEIEALDGTRGTVSTSALGDAPPVVDLKQLDRATALAPSDLEVIEKFAASRTSTEQRYLARKGWVAAKRRSLSWDGPLYPIDDGRARFPATCAEHEEKPTGPDGMEGGAADEKTKAERRRAFRWVSSGKVVSVSERGYMTEHLRAPRCDGDKLAYPVTAKRGALVPSWMVAGFTVTPVKKGLAADARARVKISSAPLTIEASTFTTTASGSLDVSGEPIAIFSEAPGVFFVLLQGPECAKGETTVFLVRATKTDSELKLEQGRTWGCGKTAFDGLDGEPRDVSHEALLKDGWNR